MLGRRAGCTYGEGRVKGGDILVFALSANVLNRGSLFASKQAQAALLLLPVSASEGGMNPAGA